MGLLGQVRMQISVNGELREISQGCTVADLLELLQLSARQVAVEINRELVPREQHQEHELVAGDQLEIVTLVGGG